MNSTNNSEKQSSLLTTMLGYLTNSANSTELEKINSTFQEPKGVSSPQDISRSGFMSKKVDELHKAHTMSDRQKGWFENRGDIPTFSQETFPTNFKDGQTKPPEPDLPTSQDIFNITKNSYENLPVYQTNYNPYHSYCQDWCTDDLQEVIEEESFVLAPSFLPLGNLYDNIIEIVQHVCQNTKPSPFRLAAETLARSKLNPNAKEFTPTMKNQEEWDKLNIEEENVETDACIEGTKQENKIPVDKFLRDTNCSEEQDIVNEDSKLSSLVESNICDNYNCDSNVVLGENDTDNDDDDDDDECEYDDSDWDSDEQSTGQCIEIDPAEFEDLFTSPLLVSNLRVCEAQSSSLMPQVCQSQEDLSSINKTFFYKNDFHDSSYKKSEKCVKFSDDVVLIEEPADLSEDLKNARISDFPARQADKERMERLLAPILSKIHREKIYQKIYQEQDS